MCLKNLGYWKILVPVEGLEPISQFFLSFSQNLLQKYNSK